jgi:L-lysine 2,3-aminomutase
MIPSKVENLLVACRAFSSEAIVNEYFNLIPHCIALGQAAGTAAAQSIDNGVSLKKQGVILPS